MDVADIENFTRNDTTKFYQFETQTQLMRERS